MIPQHPKYFWGEIQLLCFPCSLFVLQFLWKYATRKCHGVKWRLHFPHENAMTSRVYSPFCGQTARNFACCGTAPMVMKQRRSTSHLVAAMAAKTGWFSGREQLGPTIFRLVGGLGVPPNGWFIMENPNLKWMIWAYPPFFMGQYWDPMGFTH